MSLLSECWPSRTRQGCTLVSITDLALPSATRHPMVLLWSHEMWLHAPGPPVPLHGREIPGEFDSDQAPFLSGIREGETFSIIPLHPHSDTLSSSTDKWCKAQWTYLLDPCCSMVNLQNVM